VAEKRSTRARVAGAPKRVARSEAFVGFPAEAIAAMRGIAVHRLEASRLSLEERFLELTSRLGAA